LAKSVPAIKDEASVPLKKTVFRGLSLNKRVGKVCPRGKMAASLSPKKHDAPISLYNKKIYMVTNFGLKLIFTCRSVLIVNTFFIN